MIKKFYSLHIPNSFFGYLFLSSIVFIAFNGCNLLDSNDEKKEDRLYVKFYNDSTSEYTITSIELQAMGVAGEAEQPSGEWSANVLSDGTEIEPGSFTYFYADIPGQHWSKYRISVKDSSGSITALHEQNGYTETELPITHWGSDERTVSITVVRSVFSNLIDVTQWMEWAGIED